jgi:hypothetical protein
MIESNNIEEGCTLILISCSLLNITDLTITGHNLFSESLSMSFIKLKSGQGIVNNLKIENNIIRSNPSEYNMVILFDANSEGV